jgi:hypothetical protein
LKTGESIDKIRDGKQAASKRRMDYSKDLYTL